MLVLRYMFNKENKRRDAEPLDTTYDDVYIEVMGPEGKLIQKKVDKVRRS